MQVDIKYNNSTITSLTGVGITELNTKDTILRDYITVDVVSAGGGIDPSDATATANKILSGYTAYIADGSKVNGTITAYDGTASGPVGPKPTTPNAVQYDGNEHTNGYIVPTGVTMSGQDRGTNIGTYTAVYSLESGLIWNDGTNNNVTINFIISNNISVGEKPRTNPTVSYNGTIQTNGYTTPANVTMTGINSGTNAGTYTATYTPDSGYMWIDGTTDTITVTFTITPKSIENAIVTLSANTVPYTGEAQSVSITSVVVDGLTATFTTSGTTTATEIGTYTIIATGTDNFTGSISTSWNIIMLLKMNYFSIGSSSNPLSFNTIYL